MDHGFGWVFKVRLNYECGIVANKKFPTEPVACLVELIIPFFLKKKKLKTSISAILDRGQR